MKALVFTKVDGERRPLGVMTKKPSAAQIKAGEIDLEGSDDVIRMKYGRLRDAVEGEDGEVSNYICDGIATPPADADKWADVPGFKSFEHFLGAVEATEEFL